MEKHKENRREILRVGEKRRRQEGKQERKLRNEKEMVNRE